MCLELTQINDGQVTLPINDSQFEQNLDGQTEVVCSRGKKLKKCDFYSASCFYNEMPCFL